MKSNNTLVFVPKVLLQLQQTCSKLLSGEKKNNLTITVVSIITLNSLHPSKGCVFTNKLATVRPMTKYQYQETRILSCLSVNPHPLILKF